MIGCWWGRQEHRRGNQKSSAAVPSSVATRTHKTTKTARPSSSTPLVTSTFIYFIPLFPLAIKLSFCWVSSVLFSWVTFKFFWVVFIFLFIHFFFSKKSQSLLSRENLWKNFQLFSSATTLISIRRCQQSRSKLSIQLSWCIRVNHLSVFWFIMKITWDNRHKPILPSTLFNQSLFY